MYKLTQAEFSVMDRNADGYIVIDSDTDCTDVDFACADRIAFGDYCTLGNWCKLGDCCTLGNYCTLGDCCKLGNYCTLGNWCKLGEFVAYDRITFEGGRVINGTHITVGQIGSENRIAYFYIDENGKMSVRAGCWFSTLEGFRPRVHEVHKGTICEAQYMAACVYAETVLPKMLEERNKKQKVSRRVWWGY